MNNINNMQNKEVILNTIVQVLSRLDSEANKPNISPEDYAHRGHAITKILNKVENDFGKIFMLNVFTFTNKTVGHTIGPLEPVIVNKLIDLGCKINVNKVVQFKK